MRRLSVLLLTSLFLAPVALAEKKASGDGSLVVSGASARSISLKGNGLIFGHIAQGTLTVVIPYDPAGVTPPQVQGATPRIVGNTVVYTGTDVRFYFPNGKYLLRLDGTGIDVSGVGKGVVVASGIGSPDDGTVAVNGGKPQPIGVLPTALWFNGNGNSSAKAADTTPPGQAKGH